MNGFILKYKNALFFFLAFKAMYFQGRNVKEIRKMMEYIRNQPFESKKIISLEAEKPRPPEDIVSLFPLADYVFISKDFAETKGYFTKEEALLYFHSRMSPEYNNLRIQQCIIHPNLDHLL